MTIQSLMAPAAASIPAAGQASGSGAALPVRMQVNPTEDVAALFQAHAPAGTALTVTCLPRQGVGPTIRTAIELAYLGFEVVPHLAARSIESRGQLAGVVRNCHDAGITEVFAVGGDAWEPAGPYDSSLPLLEDLAELSGGTIRAGVAGYPEGHPGHSELHMLDALLEKQHLASSVVTQLCFSASRIQWYAEMLRREGVRLPVWAGVAGTVPRAQLIRAALKIGVGPSLKLLNRRGPLGRRLLKGGLYSPQAILAELEGGGVVEGVHLYTFNNLAGTGS
ncbi:methylenetetrahydrofolate reductase [Pseudarthrobacter niigatensis]|uniref:Methylenetetrahydrofolate reductase n=1 Tax=Pseudarthrobacter niigatensis TaxID=369935 RepID=A0AAJ1SVU9_9MICC|nr:methylenetetrahydrofolate reductase [Pseudarthrobacter niigatensis]MDQ0147946.1 methylenetetrahydrofolate reductase (NADPH) [Pseudarthrobacter niigatensis]MDQ0268030.1 methylenetetrahydrofolate reductase (NADPH) [Pseudarthrobacter niigatensis]